MNQGYQPKGDHNPHARPPRDPSRIRILPLINCRTGEQVILLSVEEVKRCLAWFDQAHDISPRDPELARKLRGLTS